MKATTLAPPCNRLGIPTPTATGAVAVWAEAWAAVAVGEDNAVAWEAPAEAAGADRTAPATRRTTFRSSRLNRRQRRRRLPENQVKCWRCIHQKIRRNRIHLARPRVRRRAQHRVIQTVQAPTAPARRLSRSGRARSWSL